MVHWPHFWVIGIAVCVGLAALRTLLGSGHAYLRDAAIFFAALSLVHSYFIHDSKANGNSRLCLIFALLERGSLQIDDYVGRPELKTMDKAFVDGHFYTDKALGPSLLGALSLLALRPWFPTNGQTVDLVGRIDLQALLSFLVVGLPSAICAALIFTLGRQVGQSRQASYLVAIGISLGTMCLPFSTVFFGHQLAGSLLFIAFFLILRVRRDLASLSGGQSALIGLLLGGAVLSEYTAPILAAPLALLIAPSLWKPPNRARNCACFLAAASFAALPLPIYNMAVFGSPFSVGYAHEANPVMQQKFLGGFLGMSLPSIHQLFYVTLHPSRGLFAQAPVLLAALPGYAKLLKDRDWRDAGWLCLYALLAFITLNASYVVWWGGSTFAPRYLIPCLPFQCLPLLFVPARWQRPALALGALSVFQMFLVTVGDPLAPDSMIPKLNRLPWWESSPIYNYCLDQLVSGRFAPNLGSRSLGLEGFSSLLPLILLLSGCSFVFMKKKGLKLG